MKSSVEPLEGNKVKLSVEVEEGEFDGDIDAAFRKLAREVRLPGFRAGKAPRRVLEARIGRAPAREQALRDAIPVYLSRAVRDNDVDLVATPAVELRAGADDGPVTFDATCEVRPEVTVPGYGGLRVELPSPHASDADIDEAVEAELARHARLTTVERPAARGDVVVLDITGLRDGEPAAGLNAEDWSYELGKGWVAEGFDDELIGGSAGDELEFTLTPNGTEQPADFTVAVQAVQEKTLPDLNDEWVADNVAEFETVDEWRAGLRERISASLLGQAHAQYMDQVTAALAELVEDEPPASMVEAELQGRVQNTVRQFQAQGIDLAQWLTATGQDSASFLAMMRVQAERAVRVDLALRAVAAAEGIEATADDLEEEYQRAAMRVGEPVAKVRRAYEDNDAISDLSASLRKGKALDWLLHNVEVVDPAGAPIDRDLVLGHTHHDNDHDHDDHDHNDHDHNDHDHARHEPHEHDTEEPSEGGAQP